MGNRLRYRARLAVAFPVLFLGFGIESIGAALGRAGNHLQALSTRIEGEPR
jgi:hypothetical protein